MRFYQYLFMGMLITASPLVGVPKVNLGLSSFLDGGPLRPEPGWYWSEIINTYHAEQLFDGSGSQIINGPSIDSTSIVTQFIYQGKREIAYAHPGVAGWFSVYPQLAVSKNPYGITSSGTGIGDFGMGFFLQFKPVLYHGRGILVHRLEFDASFPVGKFCRNRLINPGNGIFLINPYWAGTLFFTPHCATSWRLNYNWSSRNKKTGIQFSDAIYLNYTIEWEAADRFWIGMNSYALTALNNSTLNGIPVPDSRQRIFGVGPGILYVPLRGVNLFANFYFERGARARPEGFSAVFRVLYQF